MVWFKGVRFFSSYLLVVSCFFFYWGSRFFRRGGGFSSLLLVVVRRTRDVEVDSDTVYDWHTMLHLQLYFQGHTGESSGPGMTSLLHCNCNSKWKCNLVCNYLIHISLNLT